jgi:OOP family OmpA-OmpF porin
LIEAARTVPDPVEIDFTSGTEVPADQAAKLEALAETLGKRDDIEVELIGCSDPSGPATVNLAISKDRAASVAAMLRELGVAEDQIGAVDGRGESCSPQTRTVHVTPALRNGPHRG